MKRFLPFFLLFQAMAMTVYAQTLKISVRDSTTAEELPYSTVTITLKNTAQGTTTYATDSKGTLSLKTPSSAFDLSVSYIGYNTTHLAFDSPQSEVIFVKLSKNTHLLKVLTVSAKTPVITQTPDGYVYAVDRGTADINVNTAQLIKKLPGVVTEQNGELRLQGKPITFYIDGKPSLLAGAELTKYLQTLNLQDIKNLKILTNPPASYDASGGSIIDISTNKPLLSGIYTRADLNGGTHDKYGAGLSVNYKSLIYTGKYTLNYDHSNYYKRSGYQQRNLNGPDSLRNYDFSSRTDDAPSNNTNLTLNNDFSLNKMHTLGVTFKFSNFNNPPTTTTSQLNILDGSNRLRQQQHLSRTDRSSSNLFFIDLNYRWNLNKKGTTLTFDSYYWKRKATNTYAIQVNELINGQMGLQASTDNVNDAVQDLEIKSGAMALVHPINKYLTVSSGAKLTGFHIDGQFTSQLLAAGRLQPDPDRTYQLTYQENVYAAYVNLYGQYKKFQYSAGLRGEGTLLKLNTNRDEVYTLNDKRFFNPFPVAGIVYTLSGHSSLGLSYGRRIFRVSYSQLNPIDFRIDPSTRQRGNPALTPSTTDNFNFSYSYQPSDKHSFSLAASYLIENNPYTWLTLPDSTANTYLTEPRNYQRFRYLTLNLNQQHTLSSKLSLSANLMASEQFYNLSNLNLPDPNAVISYRASLSLDYKFWKNGVFEIYGNFKSRSTTPFGTGAPYQYIDLSASKRFCHDQLTLNLSCTDIFNLNKSRYSNDSPFYTNNGFVKNETRIAQLAISYRFGTTKKNAIKDYTPQEDTRFKN